MGRKKNKWSKKVISFFKYIFKFEVPYNILIDGNFIAVALKKKFDLKEQLTKVLDDNVHLVITSCVLNEVQEMNEKIPGLLDIIMKYKIEECNHGKILSPDQCIKTYIGKRNHKKYFVASQDPHLRLQLRRIIGIPLIFFDQNIVMLEKPSRATLEASKRVK